MNENESKANTKMFGKEEFEWSTISPSLNIWD